MQQLQQVVIVFVFLVCGVVNLGLVSPQTTVRPYKFGFTIEEQQHRSEQRDERGIVMGEFGFITADGIYHVTVYATDEEGKFRILAMKNYPYVAPPKAVEMMLVPKKLVTPVATTPPPQSAVRPAPTKSRLPKFNFKNMGCSGCFLTNDVPDEKEEKEYAATERAVKTEIRPLSNAFADIQPRIDAANVPGRTANSPAVVSVVKPESDLLPPAVVNAAAQPDVRPPTVASAVGAGPSARPPVVPATNAIAGSQPETGTGDTATQAKTPARPFAAPSVVKSVSPTGSTSGDSVGNVGLGAGTSTPGAKGTSNAARAPSDGNSGGGDNIKTYVGENGDLYRFKYILDYNGHTETGSRNGNKQGNYFVIGEDDVQRTVEYIADENGFQPRIRWQKLDAGSGTRSPENALKEYEFVWFKQQ